MGKEILARVLQDSFRREEWEFLRKDKEFSTQLQALKNADDFEKLVRLGNQRIFQQASSE